MSDYAAMTEAERAALVAERMGGRVANYIESEGCAFVQWSEAHTDGCTLFSPESDWRDFGRLWEHTIQTERWRVMVDRWPFRMHENVPPLTIVILGGNTPSSYQPSVATDLRTALTLAYLEATEQETP